MSQILLFPRRDRGRVRKRESAAAMGRCSLSLLEREGAQTPSNIAVIKPARAKPGVDEGRLALRLALGIFATLSSAQQDRVRRAARTLALHGDEAEAAECAALYELIR
jgi:hypothetical protein